MPQNGYRLIVVTLHDGRVQASQPFDTAQARRNQAGAAVPKGQLPPTIDYRAALVDDVQGAITEARLFNAGIPGASDDDDSSDIDEYEGPSVTSGASFRWNAARYGDAHPRVHFEVGPLVKDGISVDPHRRHPDVPLVGRATLHPYRASLVTRPGMTRGILAVESRGRTCPFLHLIRALKGSSNVPWRLQPHANVAAQAAVERFVRQSQVESLELIQWYYDADGARNSRRASLQLDLRLEDQRNYVRRVLSWINRKFSSDETNPDPASEAAELRGQFFATGADVTIDFNDVALVLNDGQQQKRLTPATDYRHFTYVLGRDIVSDDDFFPSAEQTADELIEDVQVVGGST